MLVLSRKPGQQIRIGDAVLTVVSVNGCRVELGIDAPPEVQITRFELAERVAVAARAEGVLQPA